MTTHQNVNDREFQSLDGARVALDVPEGGGMTLTITVAESLDLVPGSAVRINLDLKSAQALGLLIGGIVDAQNPKVRMCETCGHMELWCSCGIGES